MNANIIVVMSQYGARALGYSAVACDGVELYHLTREGLSVFEENLLQESRRQGIVSQTERSSNIVEIDLCEPIELGGHGGGGARYEIRDTSYELRVSSDRLLVIGCRLSSHSRSIVNFRG